MAQPFLGQISCYACNFAPRSWAFCNGRILAIRQNSALFAILGTTYGGDGTVTYALPNLQGQAPMHWGVPQNGLSPTVIGEFQGMTAVTLLTPQIPPHVHSATAQRASSTSTQTAAPEAGVSYLSNVPSGNQVYDNSTPAVSAMFNPMTVGMTGQTLPHNNMQPYLALNVCVAVDGRFPARN